MEPVLEICGLNKKFPGFYLKDINLVLPPGFIMGLIGPNGAGKTTLIKLVMNLVNKDSGQIKIFGRDYIKYETENKQRIGFVYDESHYYEYLSVDANRRIIAPFYRYWDDSAFHRYIRMFNIPAGKKLKDLSRGMKTKFSLAVALSHKAELIIMDEPTSGLDPVFRRELLDLLADLIQDEKRAIVFSTHITTDLERIADYICFLNQGQVVFCDTRDWVLENHRVVKGSRELLANSDLTSLLIGIRENRFGFEALTQQSTAVQKNWGDRVIIEKAGLDDIILFNVRGAQHV
ncbi:MAG: ABC transporter ATP-binding protein [Syntrophomonadaceae bacterium]|jgi:ABC-2 type transport system ATP-binding protein